MQQPTCTWYMPWALPQQKVISMPAAFGDKAATPYASTYTASAHNPFRAANVGRPQDVTAPLQLQHQQQQEQLHSATIAPQNFQHPAMHSNAYCTQFPHAFSNSSGVHVQQHSQVQNYTTQLQTPLHNHTAQILHPTCVGNNTATIFTPLALGTLLTAAGNTPNNSSTQRSLQSACNHPDAPIVPPAATSATLLQQLGYISGSVSSQLQNHQLAPPINLSLGIMTMGKQSAVNNLSAIQSLPNFSNKMVGLSSEAEQFKPRISEKRKTDESDQISDLKKAKLETKALKAKRPGFTDERYQETSYYIENGLRKVYPYYFTFTTFTKGRWVGEKILDIFAREFRAHPAEEYKRCIQTGTLTVNFEKVPIDYRLKHNDLLANIVHRHEVPVTCQPITMVHIDDDIVVVNKPASIPVHPCGRYRHNTVVFILAKEFHLKNLRTIHRLDRLTSGLLLFGRNPKKARQMEQQIRNRQVQKEYICRVEGVFPDGIIECKEPIEVISYKIGVCKVSSKGKECTTTFQKISENSGTSVVLCKPLTGRMHQIRVHLQYLGYPILNDPLYNHVVFGPLKGRGGDIGGKTDEELIRDLINIHNAENWLGVDCESALSFLQNEKDENEAEISNIEHNSGIPQSEDDSGSNSRETTPPLPEYPKHDIKAKHVSKYRQCTSSYPQDKTPPISHNSIATQTSNGADSRFLSEKMTIDKHCYECKVHYRDPKASDLIMYLHAWKYKGPDWEYETNLPPWADSNWKKSE